MKSVVTLGFILVLLGVVSFIIPIRQRENHGVKVGNAKIGILTESSEKLPPVVGISLLAGGILVLVAGTRRSWSDLP